MHNNKFDLAKQILKKNCTYSPKNKCQELFCILHEKEYLGNHTGKSHACIACNLNTSLEHIYIFLKQNRAKNNLEYTFTNYILLNYLLVEKLTTIFKIIGISQDYVQENWAVLVELRKWANFVKHPKGFLFSHHSEYIIENQSIPVDWQKHKQVTYKGFVEPLYKFEDVTKFNESLKQFANKKDLLVVIPDPHRLSEELINVCVQFCEKIKNNEHFKEILSKNSVMDNYF